MRKRTYQYADVQRYLHFNRLRTHNFAGSQWSKTSHEIGSIEKQRMDQMNIVIIKYICKLWSPQSGLLWPIEIELRRRTEDIARALQKDSWCDRLIYRSVINSLANAIMVFVSSKYFDVLEVTVKSLSSIIKTPNFKGGKKKKRNAAPNLQKVFFRKRFASNLIVESSRHLYIFVLLLLKCLLCPLHQRPPRSRATGWVIDSVSLLKANYGALRRFKIFLRLRNHEIL